MEYSPRLDLLRQSFNENSEGNLSWEGRGGARRRRRSEKMYVMMRRTKMTVAMMPTCAREIPCQPSTRGCTVSPVAGETLSRRCLGGQGRSGTEHTNMSDWVAVSILFFGASSRDSNAGNRIVVLRFPHPSTYASLQHNSGAQCWMTKSLPRVGVDPAESGRFGGLFLRDMRWYSRDSKSIWSGRRRKSLLPPNNT